MNDSDFKNFTRTETKVIRNIKLWILKVNNLLGILTLGIGLLWVTPWMEMTQVKFYEELKAEAGAA